MTRPARRTLEQTLKDELKATGQSVNALAQQSGVSQPILHRFLAGERGISLATAEKLCRFLGLELCRRR